jgi:hypothetical protein
MSVSGDFWVFPDGSCQNMGQGEHAEVALQAMLKLPEGERVDRRKIFNGLSAFTPEQLVQAKARGVPQEVFTFLSQHSPDPRYYAIKKYNWIRVAKNQLNVWMWDPETINILRRTSYWSQQPNLVSSDMFDVKTLVGGADFSVTVEKILGGQELGHAEPEIQGGKVYVGPRRGMHTDTAGQEQWQYRRIGDNRP